MTPTASDAASLRLHCTVEGSKFLTPMMTAEAICARFGADLGRALRTHITVIANRPTAPGGWIGVALRLRRPGIASAVLTDARGASAFVHPAQSIARSDTPLDASVVNLLAQQVATALLQSHKAD